MFSDFTNNLPKSPTEREDWEPRNLREWQARDKLSQVQRRKEGGEADQIIFDAWTKQPTVIRRQIWREREIAAVLAYAIDYENIPGAHSWGVGWREIRGEQRLAGIISVELEVPSYPVSNKSYGIPDTIFVDTVLPIASRDFLNVPIVLEYAPSPFQFVRIVPPNNPIETFPQGDLPGHRVLQGGMRVGGRNSKGFRKQGTLTAFVGNNNNALLVLGAQHVLGEYGDELIAELPVAEKVGHVMEYSYEVDAAIAELIEPFAIDFRIKTLNIVPAAPIPPYSNMPVQLVGGISGHQKGFIDQALNYPSRGFALGFVSRVTASIQTQGGDSGALLLSGHDDKPGIPPGYEKYVSYEFVKTQNCAMIGMLVAGPSEQASSATRAQSYFNSIIDVLTALDVEPWIRDL